MSLNTNIENISVNDFEKIINIFNKLNFAYSNLSFKARSLTKCKFYIFQLKMIYWKELIDNCIYKILNNKCDEAVLYDPTNEVIEYLKKNKLASSFILTFFYKFHKGLSSAYLSHLKQIVYNKNISKVEKLEKFVDDALELLNITLIELKDIRISCKVFNNDNEDNIFKNCTLCDDEDNVIKVNLLPEYLYFDGVLDNILNALLSVNEKYAKNILLFLNYELICNNKNNINWKEVGCDKRFQKLSEHYFKVYLMNCDCIDFGSFYSILSKSKNIIKNKKEYYNILDMWREKLNKRKKYINNIKIM